MGGGSRSSSLTPLFNMFILGIDNPEYRLESHVGEGWHCPAFDPPLWTLRVWILHLNLEI